MRRTLVAGPISGTLPILYVFLARSGKAIQDVSLVMIDRDGAVRVDDGAVGADAKSPHGVKIEFVGGERATADTLLFQHQRRLTTASGLVGSCVFASGSAVATHSSRALHI